MPEESYSALVKISDYLVEQLSKLEAASLADIITKFDVYFHYQTRLRTMVIIGVPELNW